jgi:hypothetical protein
MHNIEAKINNYRQMQPFFFPLTDFIFNVFKTFKNNFYCSLFFIFMNNK